MSTFDTTTDIDPEAVAGETALYLTDDECSDIGFMDGYFGRPHEPVGDDAVQRHGYAAVQRHGYAAGYLRGRSQRLADLTPDPSVIR